MTGVPLFEAMLSAPLAGSVAGDVPLHRVEMAGPNVRAWIDGPDLGAMCGARVKALSDGGVLVPWVAVLSSGRCSACEALPVGSGALGRRRRRCG